MQPGSRLQGSHQEEELDILPSRIFSTAFYIQFSARLFPLDEISEVFSLFWQIRWSIIFHRFKQFLGPKHSAFLTPHV